MSSKRKESIDSIDSTSNISIDSRSYSIDSIDSGESKNNSERTSSKINVKGFEKIKSTKRRNRDCNSNSYLSQSPQLSDILKLMEHFNHTHEKKIS